MKELRILCLAVVVVAGVLNASAAMFAGPHHAVAMGKTELGQRALAVNP